MMDTLNYIFFKNPVSHYSVHMIKSVTNCISDAIKSTSSTSVQNAVVTKNSLLDIIHLHRNYLRIVGCLGASAVILGAYGAHTLLAHDGNEHRKKVFKTANEYHFYHTLAFMAVPFCRFPKTTALIMACGIIIFSGSCYYQSLTGDDSTRKITPYGGSLLILAWLTMII